ncbi:hypothetical protein CCP2SC5_1930002 [Azospirillaceae bacterium]
MCAWYSMRSRPVPAGHVSAHIWQVRSAGMPVPATAYPFFLLKYRITGDTRITETEGRVDIDRHNQEAQTRLVTSFINGTRRACSYVATGDGKSAPKLSTLVPGQILKFPLTFFNPPP